MESFDYFFNRQWKDDRLAINHVLLHVSSINFCDIELLSYGKEEAITRKSPSQLVLTTKKPTNFLVTSRKSNKNPHPKKNKLKFQIYR